MILKQRRFCRHCARPGAWTPDDSGTPLALCTAGFDKLFNIPDDAKQIWLTLRDRPGVFSMALRIERVWFDQITVTAENGRLWRSGARNLSGNTTRLLREYIGRTVYLEVEYERP